MRERIFNFDAMIDASHRMGREFSAMIRAIQRKNEARLSITTKYAPAPYKNCVDI